MHIINSKTLNLSEIMLEQLGGLFKIIFWTFYRSFLPFYLYKVCKNHPKLSPSKHLRNISNMSTNEINQTFFYGVGSF